MEMNITRKFILLSLHPENGRVIVDRTHLKFALTGAFMMDFLINNEISIVNKKLLHSFRKNGDLLHDTFAERIEQSAKPRRFSYWLRKFSMRSNKLFRTLTDEMVSKAVLRHERKYFLNLFPYNRYFLNDPRIRYDILKELRNVLLENGSVTNEIKMLISLLKAAGIIRVLAMDRSERHLIRKKASAFIKNDEFATEIDHAIREMNAAIARSIAVSAASHH